MVTMMYVAQFSIRYQFHPLDVFTCGRWLHALFFLYWLNVLLVLDVDLKTFQLLEASNGKNMKSIPKWKLEEQISVSVHNGPLCGTVSMFHIHSVIDDGN